MFQPRYGGTRGQMPKSIEGLAFILSIAGTIFFAPFIWPAIRQPTMHWLLGLYGGDVASLIGFGIMLATFPLTYFAIRMSISAAYTSLLLFIGSRL
jgi:hypothetical protein